MKLIAPGRLHTMRSNTRASSMIKVKDNVVVKGTYTPGWHFTPGDPVMTRDDMALKVGELILDEPSGWPCRHIASKTIDKKSPDHTIEYAFLLMPKDVGWVFSGDSIHDGLVTHDGKPYDNSSMLAPYPREYDDYGFSYPLIGTSFNYQPAFHQAVWKP